jgi:hypothetical protein
MDQDPLKEFSTKTQYERGEGFQHAEPVEARSMNEPLLWAPLDGLGVLLLD